MLGLIVRNGRIFDGSGNPWYRADIGVTDDRITHIGNLKGMRSRLEIDAGNLTVTPGFIDIHTHSDMPLLIDGRAESHISQGVTTNVIGNCGSSLAPISTDYANHLESGRGEKARDVKWTWRSLGEYLAVLEEQGTSVNVVPLVGQGTVRGSVMGFADRPATQAEVDAMCAMVSSAMDDGAFGISTGLIYTPGCYAQTDEIIRLTRVAADAGGIYASHIRGENDSLIDAIQEAITIGRKTGAPVQISHLKVMGQHMWGLSTEVLRLVDQARVEGLDITCDQYPYEASATGLVAFLPPWSQEGGTKQLKDRLRDPGQRARIRHDIVSGLDGWTSLHKGVGWENTVITGCSNTDLEGKTVAQIAEERDQDPFDAAFNIILESSSNTSVVYFTIDEEDLKRFMRHEAVMVGSDSSALATSGPLSSGKPHPRAFGTFSRILGRYVRDNGTLTLADAVRKMTSLPAQRLGLMDRGLLRPGMKADLVILDHSSIIDHATYKDPLRYSTGVEHVFVNGIHTVCAGEHKGAKAGQVLRRS